MKTKLLPPLLCGLLALTLATSPAYCAPLQFEGPTRACAGAIDNEVHRLSLTARGFAPGETVTWSFEGVTLRDDKGRVLLTPRLWDGKQWNPTLTIDANDNGTVTLRILSGQTAEKPKLVAQVGGKVRGMVECDFGAPEMLRRFTDSTPDPDYIWRPPGNDIGYLFDGGLAVTGKRENGKVYLKFRIDPQRGDVDGNWRVVNGHKLKVGVNRVTFNENGYRSDGAKVSVLTHEKETAPYLFVRDPQNPAAKTRTVTTAHDGSASFVILAGPKYNIRDDDEPQPYISADNITVYEPPAQPPTFKVTPVPTKGPMIEWTSAASRLHGKMLVGAKDIKPQREHWKIITFEGNGPREEQFSTQDWSRFNIGIGNPFWSPDGSRFGLFAYGTGGNDHSMTLGVLNAKDQSLIKTISPPYTSWMSFSPDSRQLAFARGSTNVVGSSRVGDDYSLHVWNGRNEIKLPVNHTFLTNDEAEAQISWRGTEELLLTQESSATRRKAQPDLNIMAVAANGKQHPQKIVSQGWMPLSSPDGKYLAFYGPESKRQKPSKYYVSGPFDQPLCIARRDGKPMRNSTTGYNDRLPLERFGESYPTLFWSTDSKALYAVSMSSDVDEPYVEILRYDVTSGKRKRVATWDYQTYKRTVSNDSNYYGWGFSGLSADGKTLFATCAQFEDDPQDMYRFRTQQWFAIDLTTGKLEKLATIRNSDFAWHSSPH